MSTIRSRTEALGFSDEDLCMGDQINRSSDSGCDLDQNWKELPEKNLELTNWFVEVYILDDDE